MASTLSNSFERRIRILPLLFSVKSQGFSFLPRNYERDLTPETNHESLRSKVRTDYRLPLTAYRPLLPWLVFYTKSRQEKKVRDILQRRGFEVFLPMQKVLRQWSDRKKKVEVPLFHSYIFVSVPEYQIDAVLQIPGVAWVIRHNGKPAELHPKEYETIVRFIETGLVIETLSSDSIEKGEEVVVMDGPLKGQRGFVSSKGRQKFVVILEAIGQAIRVEIAPFLLKKLDS